MEIIVVDNGSNDGSQIAVEERFPGVRLICNEENLGFSKANNIGIRQSSGKYICIVNSDIKVMGDCIGTMLDYMEKNGLVGVLGPKTLNADLTLRKNCRKFPDLWNSLCRAVLLYRLFPHSRVFSDTLMRYFGHDTISEVDVLPGCFMMVRREALQEVGELDEGFFIYAEDKDWCKRFRDAGWRVVFNPNAEVIHYAGVSSSSDSARFWAERLRANLYYWEKHYNKFSQSLFLAIMAIHYAVRSLGWSFAYLCGRSDRIKSKNRIKEINACIKVLAKRIVKKNRDVEVEDNYKVAQ